MNTTAVTWPQPTLASAGPPVPAARLHGAAEALPRRDRLVGTTAALLAVLVWGGTLSVTRLGVAGDATLGTHDIALLRCLPPALAPLPVMLRHGVSPLRRAGPDVTLALLPGTMPLFVALLSVVLLGERLGGRHLAGFGLVAAAVALIAGPGVLAGGAGAGFAGHALLLAAAAVSAGYTIALRCSGLGPWHAAALVSAGSVLGFGPVSLLALEPRILAAPWGEVALQGVCQGALLGLVAPIAFAAAIARLGAMRAAAFGGLTPVVAALAGTLLLDEVPDGTTALAVAIAGLGVILVSQRR